MSSDFVINVTGLYKSYKLYPSPGRRFLQPFFKNKKFYTESKVLSGIDLNIKKGETVGIVGTNGAGKSTLLSIIAGVLDYDSGVVNVEGRVAALLSLGTGFVPDLTGRENIFLNAMMLGLTRRETEEQLENILEFADIGDYINQPIRTYSSGMYARLAFSVAIHTNPDILIIDETLSVGDEAFQRKCFAKIDMLKSDGVTILFVSHSAGAVLELCDRAILLSGGQRLITASPKVVIGYYQKLIYAAGEKRKKILSEIANADSGQSVLETNKEHEQGEAINSIWQERYDPNLKPESILSYESRGALIENSKFVNGEGKQVNIVNSDGEYYYQYDVTFNVAIIGARFSMLIKTINGLELGALWTAPRGEGVNVLPGQTVKVSFPLKLPFREGVYFVNSGTTGFLDSEYVTTHRVIDACTFKVLPQQIGVGDRYINMAIQDSPSVNVMS